MIHVSERGGKLNIVLGLVNYATYIVLSYFCLQIPRGIGWLSLLSPSNHLDLYRIIVGAVVYVAVSSTQIAFLFALTHSLTIALGSRATLLAHLWLIGLESFDESFLLREIVVLVLGLYLSRFLIRAMSGQHPDLRLREYSLSYFTSKSIPITMWLEECCGSMPLILSFHGVAVSSLALYTLLLFSTHGYRIPSFSLVTAYTLVPLMQLAIVLALRPTTGFLQSIALGLTSGMGLLGLLPLLISLRSPKPSRAGTATSKLRKPAEERGLFLGLATAELLGKDDEEWHWRSTTFPFYVDLEKLNTPHVVIIGASGTGKTTFAKHLIREMRCKYGYTLIIVDPHGEYRDVAEELGFRVVDASSSSVNPLVLGNSTPIERAMQVSHVISTVFNLGPLQRRMIEEVVLEAYASRGIRHDNPSTWMNEPPTLKDLVEVCRRLVSEKPEFHRVLPYLEMLAESLNAKTWISIDEVLDHDTVIDLSRVPSDFARALLVDTFMYLLLSKMYVVRYKKIQLVIDEARSLMPRAVTREVLNRLFVESRKFGFSIIVISQEIRRLPRDLINNAGMRIFFLLNEPRSLEDASKILCGAGPRRKFTVIADALRTLEPHTFVVHITGSSKMYIARSPATSHYYPGDH